MDTEKLRYGNGRDKIRSIGRALEVLNDAAVDSAAELKKIVRKDYRELADVLNDLGETAADRLRDTADKVNETTRETAARIDDSVHENPWTFMGGAAVLAAVLGFMVGRRSKEY